MAEKRVPRFIVQRFDPGEALRRRLLLASALLGVLLIGLVAGYFVAPRSARSGGHAAADGAAGVAADADHENLLQQITNARRAEQMARVATDSLRHTLADREEEISALRADLAFYSKLVGSGQQQGLVVHSAHLAPIAGSRAFNVNLTLTQSAGRGAESSGRLLLAVEGVRAGKLVVLEGEAIGRGDGEAELRYRFKYFEELHATLMLPDDFIPNRLRVTIKPDAGEDSQRNIAWTDALKSVEESDVQQ